MKSLTKNIISTVVAIMMLVSILPQGVMATDMQENDVIADAKYEFKVYIPKNTVGNVAFYPTTGFDKDNRDVFNEVDSLSYELDSETDKKYDIYTMLVGEGTYSFRASNTEGKSLGGGVIKVPDETIVDSTELDIYEVKVYLRLSKTYIINKYDDEKAEAEDFSITIFNKYGTVTMGDAFVDEKGYSCYPALIYANGNALLYYVTATPSESYADLHSLKEERKSNIAVFKGEKVQSFKLELPKAIPFTIIAPFGAKAYMYDQVLNFNTIKTEPVNITDNGDGTCNFEFVSAGSSYRVSMDGKRTQVGYISGDIGIDEMTLNVKFPDEAVDERVDVWEGRKESGVLLNINERNKLYLEVGESYKVRAYRAPWQIINTDTDNVMIEPDFHYNILSGGDIIDIAQSDGGNAGGNWAEITAKNNGMAILEVSYDAIDVSWSSKTELYGATNPRRTGVFVVTVGEKFGDVSGVDIDGEYHTQYFTGDCGVLQISPEGEKVSVEVANVWSGTLGTWENVAQNSGVFDVPIVNGNNILKITADGITDFRVVRGSKIEPVITNKTHPESKEAVYPGDELTIGFKGLFQWIPKFSGIYNPSRLYAVYQQGENIIESVKSQYNLPETTIDVTVPDDAEKSFVLENGRLTGNSLGSKWSAHRQLTDGGVPANFNASNIPLDDISLPDLIIPIAKNYGGDETEDDDYPDLEEDDFFEPDDDTIDTSNLFFDISENAVKGYVSVSFEDYGKRKSSESGVKYKNQLGEIIEATKVPFAEGDTVASVTLRLLKALDIKATYTGRQNNNFYLSSIGDFTLGGEYYESFGEFDAGAASGWMVKYNNWFINMGASEFEVEDGDMVEWLYTCSLGADIGCDWSNPSAEITGIKFKTDYGTLSPSFDELVTEYTYSVPVYVESICLQAEQENYWTTVTYTSNGRAYRPMEAIDIADGTVITIESAYSRQAGNLPTDTDYVQITIEKNAEEIEADYYSAFCDGFEAKCYLLTEQKLIQIHQKLYQFVFDLWRLSCDFMRKYVETVVG